MLLCMGCGLGLVSSLTNLSLYRALALGPLALISPVTASYGLITMALAVLLLHEIPSPFVIILLLLVVTGMILTISTAAKEHVAFPRLMPSRQMLTFVVLVLGLTGAAATTLFAMLCWLGVNMWFIWFSVLTESICLLLACGLALVPMLERGQYRWSDNQQQSGVFFGIGAMLGFGTEYFLLSLATRHLGPIQPIMASRLFSALFLFIYARYQHVAGWGEIQLKQCGSIALIGLCDVIGTVSYDIGSRESTLMVAALSSLYPLLPFLVGVVWYRERIKLPQWAGTGMIVCGMVGLSLFGK
ncbi:hypothetical protein KDAU_65100 [Dictyobacter aurantiacus]|uniref:EamA domain-containing protein n=1 Tax=Dictyobacter aurantiacus TaxID=1936993 RepID=A0A401ZQP0_9CHLR|nr:hypothetical protein KDAU_65100 [Dictyobacter aurantiacus]